MNIISKILTYLKKRRKLIKNIIMLTLVVVIVGLAISNACYKNLYNEKATLVKPLSLDKEALENQNADLTVKLQEQNILIESYIQRIEALEAELKIKQSAIEKLTTDLANETTYPDSEYVQSTYVWNYLKGLGLNDYVCAGILGNIMAEVGGQTLDISKYSCKSNNGYYGMCQWAGGRKDRLLKDFGKSLDAQCRFLGVELFEVIPKDNSFYKLQNEKQAALYFAQYYERCNSSSYAVRKTNATKALKYFTGNAE